MQLHVQRAGHKDPSGAAGERFTILADPQEEPAGRHDQPVGHATAEGVRAGLPPLGPRCCRRQHLRRGRSRHGHRPAGPESRCGGCASTFPVLLKTTFPVQGVMRVWLQQGVDLCGPVQYRRKTALWWSSSRAGAGVSNGGVNPGSVFGSQRPTPNCGSKGRRLSDRDGLNTPNCGSKRRRLSD